MSATIKSYPFAPLQFLRVLNTIKAERGDGYAKKANDLCSCLFDDFPCCL